MKVQLDAFRGLNLNHEPIGLAMERPSSFREQFEWRLLCDAFILPSGQEAWGLVVNEVMCAGRAVIVSDMVGCAPDLVRPGENGAIFRTDDIDHMAAAIRDADRLAGMGRRSLAIIERWSFAEDVAGLRQALARVCPTIIARELRGGS